MSEFTYFINGDVVGGGDAGMPYSEELEDIFEPKCPWPAPDPNKRLFTPDGQPVDAADINMDEEEPGDEDDAPTSVPVPPSITIVCEGLHSVIEMRKPRPFVPWERPDGLPPIFDQNQEQQAA